MGCGRSSHRSIEDIVAEEQLDCEFQRLPAYLHVSVDGFSKKDISSLKRDAELASEFGFDATYLKRVPYFNLLGVRFANQAKFHLAGADQKQAVRFAPPDDFRTALQPPAPRVNAYLQQYQT